MNTTTCFWKYIKNKGNTTFYTFKIFPYFAVTWKQRVLHENTIMQHLCKYYYYKSYENTTKKNYPIRADIFFTGRSIFSYFQRIITLVLFWQNYLNYTFQNRYLASKTGQNSHSCSQPVKNNDLLTLF